MLHSLPLPFGRHSILSQSSPMRWHHRALSTHSGKLQHHRHLQKQFFVSASEGVF